MKLPASISFFAHPRLRPSLAFGLALVSSGFFMPIALADDSPFDLESSSWMSFDRYKEKPSSWLTPDERTQVALQPVIAPVPVMPPDLPKITAPTRDVVPPVMPAFNNGFDVQVNSTEDNNKTSQSLLDESQNKPDLQPDSKNWKDAAEVAHRKAGDEGQTTLGVRFSYLPPLLAAKAAPAAPVAKKVAAAAPVKTAPPVVAPAPSVDPAICAALDAYKKRQLAALESDRETLTALKNVIAQLGLQKQLDFATGAGGVLDAQMTDGAGTNKPAAAAPAGNRN